MRWSDIPFTPSAGTLRQFAGLWTLSFGGLACWQGFPLTTHGPALVLAALALTIGPLGLAMPRAIRPLFVGWMVVAFPISWGVSRLILACLFYAVFTPVGLLFRLTGRDVLRRRYDPGRSTYWVPKPLATNPRRYLREY